MRDNERSKIQDSKDLVERKRISIKQWNVEYFFRIIDEELQDFLKNDRCYILADKYLIAMVFMYFLRASFLPEEYTRFNFLVALYLAHAMEEDEEDNRAKLLELSDYSWSHSTFYDGRDELFKRIGYRAVVSRACCEVIMNVTNPKHIVWKRQRDPAHAGAIPRFHRSRSVCPNCIGIESPNSS